MKKIMCKIAMIVLLICLVPIGAFSFFTITEYKPKDVEPIEIFGNAAKKAELGKEIRMISWNIGYCSLGKDENFFMDGGSKVRPDSKEVVETNLVGITDTINKEKPDIIALQEVDINSKRSYKINEGQRIAETLQGYGNTFSYNFNSAYVPYPFPPIGKVESGVMAFSSFYISNALRHQLPVPFKWPVSTVNLKRCVEEIRIEIEDTDKELVIFNAHLEAYDSGEGKIAQTKKLAEIINKEKSLGNYVIVSGDYNQTFSNVEKKFPNMGEEYWQPAIMNVDDIGEGWQFLMDKNIPSCRSLDRAYDKNDKNFQYYVIDGFIVSDNIEVTEFEAKDLGFVYSDHNPVSLTFRLL